MKIRDDRSRAVWSFRLEPEEHIIIGKKAQPSEKPVPEYTESAGRASLRCGRLNGGMALLPSLHRDLSALRRWGFCCRETVRETETGLGIRIYISKVPDFPGKKDTDDT